MKSSFRAAILVAIICFASASVLPIHADDPVAISTPPPPFSVNAIEWDSNRLKSYYPAAEMNAKGYFSTGADKAISELDWTPADHAKTDVDSEHVFELQMARAVLNASTIKYKDFGWKPKFVQYMDALNNWKNMRLLSHPTNVRKGLCITAWLSTKRTVFKCAAKDVISYLQKARVKKAMEDTAADLDLYSGIGPANVNSHTSFVKDLYKVIPINLEAQDSEQTFFVVQSP